MQYKTTIEVNTEADNEHEAADIAGAFLKGEIETGADIRVNTISVIRANVFKTTLVVFSLTALAATSFIWNQAYKSRFANVESKKVTSYAIQPPLRTNMSEAQGKEFKNSWKKVQNDRIDSIAR